MYASSQSLAAGVSLKSSKRTYVIEKALGQGGFGITYLANTVTYIDEIAIEASVAVKELFIGDIFLRKEGDTAVTFYDHLTARVMVSRKDFLSEARRLQQVGKLSRNIVKVSEVFETNNTAYYVMEYINGQSLYSYIKKKGRLSDDEAKALIGPIAEALRVLHANRMTHLDVKPDNIVLACEKDGSLRPVLIDFGLAKHYDENGNATSTINSMGFSEGYAPIEQYTGITTFSPASDVYALGATLFHALTGRRPAKASEVDLAEISVALEGSDLRDLVLAAMAYSKASRPLLNDPQWQVLSGMKAHEPEVHIVETHVMEAPSPPLHANIVAPQPEEYRTFDDAKPRRRWLFPAISIATIAIIACFMLSGKTDQREESDLIAATDTIDAEDSQLAATAPMFNAPATKQPAQSGGKDASAPCASGSVSVPETTQVSVQAVTPGHAAPANFELCAVKDGQPYYFTKAEWNRIADKGAWTKKGIYLRGFIVALHDENGKMTWDEAMERYGSRLPNRDLGQVIGKNNTDLNDALDAFGGSMMKTAVEKTPCYWTCTEENSSYAWYVFMLGGYIGSINKADTLRVRTVLPVSTLSK